MERHPYIMILFSLQYGKIDSDSFNEYWKFLRGSIIGYFSI